MQKQSDVMKKALEDIRRQKKEEEQLRREQLAALNRELERVRGMVRGIADAI